MSDENVKLRDWRRVRKNYERSKQYVFVAATLPVNGKKTAGGVLKYMFPDAEWVCGNYLIPRSNDSAQHKLLQLISY